MRRLIATRPAAPLVALAALALAACSDDSSPGVEPPVPMPDFTLTDVNPTSPSADEAVSPRDYLQRVSAWYFGHAT